MINVRCVSDSLEIRFGGKWVYDRCHNQWNCDDGNRYVCSALTGRDFEGEYTGETRMFLYYRNNEKLPEFV